MPFLVRGLGLLEKVSSVGLVLFDDLVLKHGDQTEKLRALDLLWIEIVCLSDVQMADDVLHGALLE